MSHNLLMVEGLVKYNHSDTNNELEESFPKQNNKNQNFYYSLDTSFCIPAILDSFSCIKNMFIPN